MEFNNNKPSEKLKSTTTPLAYLQHQTQNNQQMQTNQQNGMMPPQVISIDLSRKSKQSQSVSQDSQSAKLSQTGSDQDSASWSQKSNPRVMQYSLPQSSQVTGSKSPQSVIFFNQNGDAGFGALQSQPTPTSTINIVNYKHKNYPAQSVTASNRLYQEQLASGTQSQISLSMNSQPQLRDVSGMNALKEYDDDQELQNPGYAREDDEEEEEEDADNNIDEMMSSSTASMIAQSQTNRFLQHAIHSDRMNYSQYSNRQDASQQQQQPINSKLINSSSITRKQPQNIKQINSSQVNPSSFQLQTQMLSPSSLQGMKQLRAPMSSSEMFNAFQGNNKQRENHTMVNISKSQWSGQGALDISSQQVDKTPNSMNKFEFNSRLSSLNQSNQYQQIVPKRLMEQANFNEPRANEEVKMSARGISKPNRQHSDSDEEEVPRNQCQDEEFYSMTEQDADAHQDAIEVYEGSNQDDQNQDILSQSQQDQDFLDDDQEPQEEEEEDQEDFKAFEQNNLRNGLSIDKYGDAEQEEEYEDTADNGEIRDSQKSISPDERKSQPIQIQEPNQIVYFSNSQVQSPQAIDESSVSLRHSRQNSQHSSNYPPRSSGRTEMTSSAVDGTRASDNQPFFNIQSYSGGVVEKNERFVVVKPGQGQHRETTQSSVFAQQHMIERNLQSHNNKVYRETVEDINSSEGEEEQKKHSKIKSYNKQRRSVPDYLQELDQSEQEQYQILSHSPIEEERYGKTQVMDHTSMIEESRIDYSQLKSMTNQIISPTATTVTAFNQALSSTAQSKQLKNQNNKHSDKHFFDDSSRNQYQQPQLQNRNSEKSVSSANEKFNRLKQQQRKDFVEDNPLPIEQTQEVKNIHKYFPQESSQRNTYESQEYGEVNEYDPNFPQFQHIHQQTSSSNNILDFGTQEIVEPLKMADRRQSDSAVLARNSIQNQPKGNQRPSQIAKEIVRNQNSSSKIQKQSYDYQQKNDFPENAIQEQKQVKQNTRLQKEQTQKEQEDQKLLEEYKMLKMQMKVMQKTKAQKLNNENQPVKLHAAGQDKSQVLKSQEINKMKSAGAQANNLQKSRSRKRLQQQESFQNEKAANQRNRNALSSYQSLEGDQEYARQENKGQNFRNLQNIDNETLYTVQQSVKSKDGRGKNLFKDKNQQLTSVQTGRRENKLLQKLSPQREVNKSRDLSKGYKSSKNHKAYQDVENHRKQRRDISSSVSPDPRHQYINQKTNRTYVSKQNPTFRDNQRQDKHQRQALKANQRRLTDSQEDSEDQNEHGKMKKKGNLQRNKLKMNQSPQYSDEYQNEVYRSYDEEERLDQSEEHGHRSQNSYEQQEDLSDYSRTDSNVDHDSQESYDQEDSQSHDGESYQSEEESSDQSGRQKRNHKRTQKRRKQKHYSNSENDEEGSDYDDEEDEGETKVITKTAKYGNKKLKININMHEKKSKKQSKRQKEEEMLLMQQKQILQQQQLVLQMAQYPHQQMLLQQQQLAMQQQLLLQPQLAAQAQILNPQVNLAAHQTRLLDITSPTIQGNVNGQNTSFVPSSNNVSMLGGQTKRFQRDGSSSHFTGGRRDTSNGERYTGSFATNNNKSQQPPGSLRRANELLNKHFSPRRDDLFGGQGQQNRQQYPVQNNQRGDDFNTMYSPREENANGGGSRSFIGGSGRQDSFYDEQIRYQNQQQQQSTSYLHQIKNRMKQRDEIQDFNEDIGSSKIATSRNRQQMLQTNSSPVKYENDLNQGRYNQQQLNKQGGESAHQRFGSRDRPFENRQQRDFYEYDQHQQQFRDRKAFDYQDKRSQERINRQNRVFSQQDIDEEDEERRFYFNEERQKQKNRGVNYDHEERHNQISRRQSDVYNKDTKNLQDNRQGYSQYQDDEDDDSLIYSKYDKQQQNQHERSQVQRKPQYQRLREDNRDNSQDPRDNIDFYGGQNRRDSQVQEEFDNFSQPVLEKKPTGNFAELTKQRSSQPQIQNEKFIPPKKQPWRKEESRSQERSRSANERSQSFDEGVQVSNLRASNQISPRIDLSAKGSKNLQVKKPVTKQNEEEENDCQENKKKAQMIIIGFDDNDNSTKGDPFKNKPQLKQRDKASANANEARSVSQKPIAKQQLKSQKEQENQPQTQIAGGGLKFEVNFDEDKPSKSPMGLPKRVAYQRNKDQNIQQDQVVPGGKEPLYVDISNPKKPQQKAGNINANQKNVSPRPDTKVLKAQPNFTASPQKTKEKQFVLEDGDPQHNRDLGIEIFDKKQGNKGASAPEKSLAEMFLAKKKEAQLARVTPNVQKQVVRDQDYHSNLRNQQEVSPDRATASQRQGEKKGEKTKEELAELRKKMMKNRVKSTRDNFSNNQILQIAPNSVPDPAQEQIIKKQKEKEDLMIRLAMGKKIQVDKKEMKKLTNKNFQNLPEIKKKREEEKKRQELAERKAAAANYMKEFAEKRRMQLLKKQRSNVNNEDQ